MDGAITIVPEILSETEFVCTVPALNGTSVSQQKVETVLQFSFDKGETLMQISFEFLYKRCQCTSWLCSVVWILLVLAFLLFTLLALALLARTQVSGLGGGGGER